MKAWYKAHAENGVLLVERWILAALRHHEFFSLSDLNEAISLLLESLNTRAFQRRPESRRDLFEALDRPALRALPDTPYEFADWRHAKVGIDYHIDVERVYYSVPHRLVGERVDVRITSGVVEVLQRGRRVAAHVREPGKRFHTVPEHMPALHRAHAQWSPKRFLDWGADIGQATAQIVRRQLEDRPHPEHGYRSCLGLLSLGRQYGHPRLERACQQALSIGTVSSTSVRSILKNGLDLIDEPPGDERQLEMPLHENVRGEDYFQ